MIAKVRFQKPGEGRPTILLASVKVGPTPDSWGRIIIDAMAALAAVFAVGTFCLYMAG